MEKETKANSSVILWFLVVFLVVGFLVFITINKKASSPEDLKMEADKELESMLNQETNEIAQTEGVAITVLKEGQGDEVKFGDSVSVNYTGSLADGTTFDSNVDPKFKHTEPFVFTLGEGRVIKGWEIGVNGMKVGEKRKLVIEPAFAYGESGRPPVIPQNAVLNFEVELVAINK